MAVLIHTDDNILYLIVDEELIVTTTDHPFYTTNEEWVEAGDLEPGDRIVQADGTPGEVQSSQATIQPQMMWDLTVADAHTFFVGSGQSLVHNCKINYPPSAKPKDFVEPVFGEGFGTPATNKIGKGQKVSGVEVEGVFYPEDVGLPRGSSRNSGDGPYDTVTDAWNAAKRRANEQSRESLDFVQVSEGKWRSSDNRYQIRALWWEDIQPKRRPFPHVHLELLNPNTGDVLSNVHFNFRP